MKAYLLALVMVAAAALLQRLLAPWIGDLPFSIFFPMVIVATFLCGSAAGLLAAAMSALIAWLVFIPGGFSYFSIHRTALFGIGSVTVAAIVAVMRAAVARQWQLSEDLRLSEEKFRSLLESAPDAMIIIDEQRRIRLVNAQAETLFGYPRWEIVGNPIELLFPTDAQGPYLTRLSTFMADRAKASAAPMFDLEGRRKDGQTFPIEISLRPIATHDGILVSNAIRDITARRETEARLEDASRSKTEFLARVSHELRTPLNAIIGFSELVRDTATAPKDFKYRDYGIEINDAGRHLLHIINEILDISKIDSARLRLRDDVVSLAEAAAECCSEMAAHAKLKDIELRNGVSAALPSIRTDQERFGQILLNLLSNAIKFTPVGGVVTLSASAESDGLVIVVEDTGIGMEAKDIPVALEPFGQVEGILTRRFEGPGLGLPLTKALVELHGGRLEIASIPGAGTKVSIHWPRERIVDAPA